jgi:hypothetical protein
MGFKTQVFFFRGTLDKPSAKVSVFWYAEVPEDFATGECRRLPCQHFACSIERDDASFSVRHDDESVGRIQHRLDEIVLPLQIRLLFFQCKRFVDTVLTQTI